MDGQDGDWIRMVAPRIKYGETSFLGNPAQIRSFRFIQVGQGGGGGDEMVVDWAGFGGDMGGFGRAVRGFGRGRPGHWMVQTPSDGSSPDVP